MVLSQINITYNKKERLQQENVQQNIKEYEMKEDELLMHKNRIYFPSSEELRNLVLKEMHNVPYVGHPSYQKKIAVVRNQFFWSGMKKYVADYISICTECQRVKAEHSTQQFCYNHYQFQRRNGKW
jgi:hypothetical protein